MNNGLKKGNTSLAVYKLTNQNTKYLYRWPEFCFSGTQAK